MKSAVRNVRRSFPGSIETRLHLPVAAIHVSCPGRNIFHPHLHPPAEILALQRDIIVPGAQAGVSHDIRTPLSMVMGYAGQLKEDTTLPDEARQKAAVIVKQSERMKNLISDLNLASKLEYNMQPLHRARENMIAILRQAAVDFMNLDIDGKYPIVWETEKTLTACPVMVDKELIKRAFSNLIQNSMRHNPQGCRIFIRATEENGICSVEISDDGVGASDKQLEKLNRTHHSMGYHENAAHQRHGLGLLLVKQILAAHGGETAIGRSPNGGFSVTLRLPSNITSSTQTFPSGSP